MLFTPVYFTVFCVMQQFVVAIILLIGMIFVAIITILYYRAFRDVENLVYSKSELGRRGKQIMAIRLVQYIYALCGISIIVPFVLHLDILIVFFNLAYFVCALIIFWGIEAAIWFNMVKKAIEDPSRVKE